MSEHIRKLQDRYVQLHIKSNKTVEEQIELRKLRLALRSHYGKFGRTDNNDGKNT